MTVAESRSTHAAEKLLLRALVLSLLVHLAVYSGWKWGQTHAWWQRLTFPSWLQLAPHNLRSIPPVQLVKLQKQPTPPPLLYVDVDPALTADQPPPSPKYYSTANTVAANPEPKKASTQPNIAGTQDKLMQTVPTGVRAAPLQPSPPADEKSETADKETAETKAQPKPTLAPGDLASAKPAAKTEPSKGAADSEAGTAAVTAPKRERPRTLAEARARAGAPNEKTRQEGGVNHIAVDSSLDAMRTVYGDYDRDLIQAVDQRWRELLQNRAEAVTGHVKLSFNLHPDGRVTNMKMEESDVSELLGIICEQAILDPAPFKRWPDKMREEIPDPRPITFTFYYTY